jgi:hypothetical protein
VPPAAVLSVNYIIPGIGIILAVAYYIYNAPTLVSRVINEMTSGAMEFVVVAVLFGVIIWRVYYMLGNGLRSLAEAAVWIKTKRAATEGNHHCGLLFDHATMVIRRGDGFEDYNCAFLPRNTVKGCVTDTVRVEGAKRFYTIDVVKLGYTDQDGQPNELVLKENFLMTAPEVHNHSQQ